MDARALLAYALSVDRCRTGRQPGRYRQYARNFLFYDAPVGLFFSIDRTMGPPHGLTWAVLFKQ